ncbi:hypothetical protein PUN28_014582 [Cardiocondyla obscurior]|uniref:Uncharacterized protein n=1 Tax=Cardiocondyla obscurior TaxID=286306 RepID=A0AAW2F538_9HYME
MDFPIKIQQVHFGFKTEKGKEENVGGTKTRRFRKSLLDCIRNKFTDVNRRTKSPFCLSYTQTAVCRPVSAFGLGGAFYERQTRGLEKHLGFRFTGERTGRRTKEEWQSKGETEIKKKRARKREKEREREREKGGRKNARTRRNPRKRTRTLLNLAESREGVWPSSLRDCCADNHQETIRILRPEKLWFCEREREREREREKKKDILPEDPVFQRADLLLCTDSEKGLIFFLRRAREGTGTSLRVRACRNFAT